MKRNAVLLTWVLLLLTANIPIQRASGQSTDAMLTANKTKYTGVNESSFRIQPYSKNPFYWQYKGKPVVLLGGSDDDNPFNRPDDLPPHGLASHLNLLASVGGNYIRNSMSSRDKGSLWPFKQLENGKYDLKQWNDAYWERFESFLQLTHERNIIVQLEIWDPWDFYRDSGQGGWSGQPFNPENNINYSTAESELPTRIDYKTGPEPSEHSFFHTVPAMKNNQAVLPYQQAFVAKILEHSFAYPHVLYCLSNEIGESLEWSMYWAKYIHEQAKKKNLKVQVADMRRANDLSSGDQRFLQEHPQIFTFLEISQNNGGHSPASWKNPEQKHWQPITELRQYLSHAPRPMNNTKIYGALNADHWGGVEQALQKFWRNIFAGCAAVRFHRPDSGPGLNQVAQRHIRGMRMLTEEMDVFTCKPGNHLLTGRSSNEAYCLAREGKQYALYFPAPGEVMLDLSPAKGKFSLRWLDIAQSRWSKAETLQGGKVQSVKSPAGSHVVALIVAQQQ